MSSPETQRRAVPRLVPAEAARIRAGVAVALALVGVRWGIAAWPPAHRQPGPSCGAALSWRAERLVCTGPAVEGVAGLWLGRRLDLNAASAEDLTVVPGIGPALAARLVEARKARGGFERVGEVEEVKGIGPALRGRLEAYVEVRAPGSPGAGRGDGRASEAGSPHR